MIYTHCPECCGPLLDVIDISDLSERHQLALERFVEKYKKGAKEHNDLPQHKDWTREALDEVVDMAFYLLFELESHERRR